MHTAPSLRLLSADRLFAWVDRLSDSLNLSVPPIATPEELHALPPGSLGRSWFEFVRDRGLSLLTRGPRRKQLHDAVHVLTGYDSDDWGELEVQAFLYGCKRQGFHLLLGLGLARRVGLPLVLSAQGRDRLKAAYVRGQAAAEMFDPDTWPAEFLLAMPLEEVRDLLGIDP